MVPRCIVVGALGGGGGGGGGEMERDGEEGRGKHKHWEQKAFVDFDKHDMYFCVKDL